jgi:hypothetical protein
MASKDLKESSFSIEHGSLVRDLQSMIESMSPEALGNLAQSLYGVEFAPFGDELAAEYGFRVTSLWADDGPTAAFEAAKRNFEASNSIISGQSVYLREADLRAYAVQDLQDMPQEMNDYIATVVGTYFSVRVDTGYSALSGALFRIAPFPESLVPSGELFFQTNSYRFNEAVAMFGPYATEDTEFTACHASPWPTPVGEEAIVLDRACMIAALTQALQADMTPEEIRDFAAELFNVKAGMSVIPGTGDFVYRLTSFPGAEDIAEFEEIAAKMAEAGRLVSPEELKGFRPKVSMAFS